MVVVTLCSCSPDLLRASEDQGSRVNPVAEYRFSFVQDLAFDMAQFLVSEMILSQIDQALIWLFMFIV